jgi:hypothetical protein
MYKTQHLITNGGGEVPSSGNLSVFSNPKQPAPKNAIRERYLCCDVVVTQINYPSLKYNTQDSIE